MTPLSEIMAHLGCVLQLPHLIPDDITLEHIRAAHDLAVEEWRKEGVGAKAPPQDGEIE